MNNEYTEYSNRRKRDVRCENLCAAYVDKNFYSRLPSLTYERVSARDEESIERQKLGEDVVLRDKDGHIKCIIDEKAKIQGHLNDIITYPSFEIIRRPLPDLRHTLGWFSHPVSNTTHYAMISIGTNREVQPFHEYTLNEEDITCAVYGLICKKTLVQWIKEQTFKSIEEITNDAYQLFQQWKTNPQRQKWGAVKVYREDWRGKYIHLKLSANMDNQPVNLVIRRDVLRNDGLIREYYIDDKRAMKYRHPETFTIMGEKLEAMA